MKNSHIEAFKLLEERYPEPTELSTLRWKDVASLMVEYAALPFDDETEEDDRASEKKIFSKSAVQTLLTHQHDITRRDIQEAIANSVGGQGDMYNAIAGHISDIIRKLPHRKPHGF